MRALLLTLTLLGTVATGCGDACLGYDGTCVSLEVTGPGEIDLFTLTLDGAAHGFAVAPSMPQRASLPQTLALHLSEASDGPLTIEARAVLAGVTVGTGKTQTDITAGGHASAELALLPVTGAPGGAVNADLSAVDATALDLSMPPDLAACSTETLAGTTPVTVMQQADDAQPAFGGSIADGRYVLIQAMFHTGAGGATGALGTLQTALSISGSTFRLANSDSGLTSYGAGSLAASANALSLTSSCPEVWSASFTYSVGGAGLILYSVHNGIVLERMFAKQ